MNAAIQIENNEQLAWWKNKPGYKPCILLTGLAIFLIMVFSPVPGSLLNMVKEKAPPGYKLDKSCATIIQTVNKKMRPKAFAAYQEALSSGKPVPVEIEEGLISPEKVAQMAKIMIGILLVAALFWGTEAIPLGGTDIMIAVLMYLFFILPPNEIARAYLKDAVFFIFGILAVAVGVGKTGLDKRIGLLLLSRIKSTKQFCFIFFPMFAVSASFLSEHALVALLIPVVMGIYKETCRAHGVDKDPALAILLLLGLCFVGNIGGPGSPAAGGRNAVMVGYLAEMGAPISFTQWMVTGLPFVPVMAFIGGIYLYIVLKPKFKVPDMNPSVIIKQEAAKLPKFGGKEAIMAVILVVTIIMWITTSKLFGLGGPTLMAVFAMMLSRILTWDDIQQDVPFDVVGLYAAACAMGAGLKFTGGALWLARGFVEIMPDFLTHGTGLPMGVALMTGTLTNLMSDGATVSALGPVVLPMATLTDVHIWKVGLACAFSSSFAHCLVVGTPNNAIAFGLGKDPETGERMLDVMDFVKFGVPFWIICMITMYLWVLVGYWTFISWPA
ncbi:MAG: SLC13 family permease, partial [Thermodesulfobacteriota bacterium]|nr:SLC13 family permease [Thermodesulfobacteriota bacterium]